MMINCITRAVLAKLHKNHAVAVVIVFEAILVPFSFNYLGRTPQIRKC